MDAIDLNLLRVFDVIYRTRNVSRASEQLGMSQPSTSQALTRLRLALGDPLFERTRNGMRPTPRADELARFVQTGLAHLDAGLAADTTFDPQHSTAELRIHLTDIGEARFLPSLMADIRRKAPGILVNASTWQQAHIATALDNGDIHLAIGFLPELKTSAQEQLLADRYVVLLRKGHPITQQLKRSVLSVKKMQTMDLVAVRSHAQTLQMLKTANLERQVKLTTSTFLALPAIVRSTNLAALMPLAIARDFLPREDFALLDTDFPSNTFIVSVHWSRRHEHSQLVRWAISEVIDLFKSG